MIFSIMIFFKVRTYVWEWWYMLVIPGGGRARDQEFKASFSFIESLRLFWDPISRHHQQQQQNICSRDKEKVCKNSSLGLML